MKKTLQFITFCLLTTHISLLPLMPPVEATAQSKPVNQIETELTSIDSLIESFDREKKDNSVLEKQRPLVDRLPAWLIKFGSYLIVAYAKVKEKVNNLYLAAVGTAEKDDKPSRLV